MKLTITSFALFWLLLPNLRADDGYRLWLKYDKITNASILTSYQQQIQSVWLSGNNPTDQVIQKELDVALSGLLDRKIPWRKELDNHQLIITTKGIGSFAADQGLRTMTDRLSPEGFFIRQVTLEGKSVILIMGNDPVGTLYGVFHFLRLIQMQQDIRDLAIEEHPRLKIRMLDHWDNLDRTVERGYAGFSIWDWHRLPDYMDPRYLDYARANASIGINGAALTNVNANHLILRPDYLDKVKALADLFRPYGIKVYLTARFSAPVELGNLETADPLDPRVQQWWKNKVTEIYTRIPDFGGFLVKANSEGQPGPQNYHRSHAEGANLLADALAPHGGIVIWRAFVYSNETPDDRAKQAYQEFVPLDGSFRPNVMIQVKNGPIDFQPREPFHPLFGAMPNTPLMMEFQITQEYLGQGTHLVYLGSMWQEVLKSDTYAHGAGSTVTQTLKESPDSRLTGMAGVANIGTDRNWTGHLFGQANWYAFGRLCWDPDRSADAIAGEWIRQTFSNQSLVVATIQQMMMASREYCVDYMTPLGLAHLMATGHHYGPGPWVDNLSRADWNPTYYHRADSAGIGFDRTAAGSNALEQYAKPVRQLFESRETCPEALLLWFHHLGWQDRLQSGQTLWEALCHHYDSGVSGVKSLADQWVGLHELIDPELYDHVRMMLNIQRKESVWWRDASLSYWQSVNGLDLPAGVTAPEFTLNYYKSLSFPYAPGIRPRW